MEEQSEYCCSTYKVVAFDSIEILVVAASEGVGNAVKNIARKDGGECLLNFEY